MITVEPGDVIEINGVTSTVRSVVDGMIEAETSEQYMFYLSTLAIDLLGVKVTPAKNVIPDDALVVDIGDPTVDVHWIFIRPSLESDRWIDDEGTRYVTQEVANYAHEHGVTVWKRGDKK